MPVQNSCLCASQVRCQPCSSVYVPRTIPSCPCAPQPICPKCPSLSIIHSLAMQKAEKDARIASNITNLTFKLNLHLKKISELSNEIAQFEGKAREAAQKMEQSFSKAQIAKSMMIDSSNKARMVASATLSNAKISIGDIGDNLPSNLNPDLKIFPEEISSVGDYLKEKQNNNLRENYNHEEHLPTVFQRSKPVIINKNYNKDDDDIDAETITVSKRIANAQKLNTKVHSETDDLRSIESELESFA